ncbi:MAG: DUF1861 family protein, partial [Bacilli bacterium]
MNKNIPQLLEEAPINTNEATIIKLEGFKDYDVYNITAPLLFENNYYIIGRVEKRESEDSFIAFFKQKKDQHYEYDKSIPTYPLQDPFFTIINNEYIIGGVKTIKDDTNQIVSWSTILLKGNNLRKLQLFFEGPLGMKDLRIHQLPNQQILVLTRPQGIIGGLGKIGAVIIDNLSLLTSEIIIKAPLLPLFS